MATKAQKSFRLLFFIGGFLLLCLFFSLRQEKPHPLTEIPDITEEKDVTLIRELPDPTVAAHTPRSKVEAATEVLIKDIVEQDEGKLRLPLMSVVPGGFVEGSQLLLKGVFRGQELVVELFAKVDTALFHLNVRPAHNCLMLNTYEGGAWGTETRIEGISLVDGEKFEVTVTYQNAEFTTFINGVQQGKLPSRTRQPPENIARVSVWCRGGGDACASVSQLELKGVPASKPPKAKPKPADHTVLFIAVMSSPENREKRDGIRKAWFQDVDIERGLVKAAFFLGRATEPEMNDKLAKEAEELGDIIFVDMDEAYYSIIRKTAGIMSYTAHNVKSDFVMKCDDDTYVRVDRVLGLLANQSPENLYMGLISGRATPIRNPDSKWYVPPKLYPGSFYPPFAHGPGYIVSHDLAVLFDQDLKEEKLFMFFLEDVGVGIWVDRAIEVHKRPVKIVNNPMFLTGGCQTDAIIGHYLGPSTMMCMWGKYEEGNQNFCC